MSSLWLLVILIAGLATINAAGVFSQLVAAHVGERKRRDERAEREAAVGGLSSGVPVSMAFGFTT